MINDEIDALLKAGKTPEALTRALDHVRANPRDADGYLALSDVYIEKEDYASATVAASDAYRVNPRSAKALETLGWLYLTDGNIPLAEKHFTESVRVDEQNAFVWGNLGIIASMGKDHELAERRYKKAIAIDKDDATAWVNLGVTYTESGRDTDALDAFAKAKALRSKDVRVAAYIDHINRRTANMSYGKLITLPVTPALFTVSVPEDWDSGLDVNVVRVQSGDKRSMLLISIRSGSAATLAGEMETFRTARRSIRVVSPLSEETKGAERIARMAFIAAEKDGEVFYALAGHSYGTRIVEATFSSSHPYSESLAALSKKILASLTARSEHIA